jgi:sulfide:quinone oxidoreductase
MRPLRVVVVGAGVAAIETCLALRALADARVTLTLVAPGRWYESKPAAVGEPFGAATVHRFDLDRIAADVGAERVRESASLVDSDRNRLLVDDGHRIGYDALVLACGAIPAGAVPGAVTFAGLQDAPLVRAVVDEMAAGEARRLVFAVPSNVGWTMPLYELALLSAKHLADRGARGSLAIVSPEPSPLPAFGAAASREVHGLLDEREIAFHGGRTPIEFRDGALRTSPGGTVPADHVVAIPRLRGVRLDGIPADADGLVRTDRFGRVAGVHDVYAAGDITAFPIKQGGIAAQQADAVALTIAAHSGARVLALPFKPVLRGLLLTGDGERYLSSEITGGSGDTSTADSDPTWWPPVKIPGRYLGPYLAGIAAESRPVTQPVDAPPEP